MDYSQNLVKGSRYLSKLLRHSPEDLKIDKNGWVNVSEILVKLKIKLEDLEKIVAENNKKRFAFNEDKTKIRANQGHSIEVDVELKEVIPPDVLYHGTSKKNVKSILENGILKMNRLHVHLSSDLETAYFVGKRHGEPITFDIDTKTMYENGIKFYLSENKVYLTDDINPKYIL